MQKIPIAPINQPPVAENSYVLLGFHKKSPSPPKISRREKANAIEFR